MGHRRVAALLLLAPLVLLALTCSARTRPRSDAAIVFTDDRFGNSWGRFRARPRPPSFSARTALGEQVEPFSPKHRPSEPRQPFARLELPPREAWPTQEESKLTHEPAAERARTASSSSAIVFPGHAGYEMPTAATTDRAAVETPMKGKEEEQEMPVCDGVPFRVRDLVSGECRSLAMRSGCTAGEWFVLDRETFEAACRPHPCPIGFAMFHGVCQNLSDASVCGEQMVLQVDEFGDASCDCALSCVFWPAEQRCYSAMMRGPCAEGQQLTVNASGVVCAPNPCGRDGWARWPETGTCHPLRDFDDAPCLHGRMDVDSTSLQLVCNNAVANSVFATPSIRCAAGSRRALGGRCKRRVKSNTSPLRFAGGGRRCPSGFVETPDGGCLKNSSGSLGGLG